MYQINETKRLSFIWYFLFEIFYKKSKYIEEEVSKVNHSVPLVIHLV